MKQHPHIHNGTAVTVMGLGLSGRAAVRYLHQLGARVSLSEQRRGEQLGEEEQRLLQSCCADWELGGHTLEFVSRGEYLVVSPGLPGNLAILEEARRSGIVVLGELALAAPVIEARVAAVSGTNGKTTVTTLIGEMVKAAGVEAEVCGNIGRPLLDVLSAPRQPEALIVEVSSFQLENSGDFRPDVAVLLNVTPDHIDWHGSLGDYIRAKGRLFANQGEGDAAIICDDDAICVELAAHLSNVEPVMFGHSKDCGGSICESSISVRGDRGLEKYDLGGTVFDTPTGRKNSAAAILAARNMGVGGEVIRRVLRTFKMLPHRMEFVDSIRGVKFYNDSKATNTGAVASALGQFPGRVVLIAGGRDKGDDYTLLRGSLAAKVRAVVLIGEAADQMAAAFAGTVPLIRAGDMAEAVTRAFTAAVAGDTVLLSPACASFDMFASYGHRGEVFRECVAALKGQTQEEEAEER